MYDRRAIMLKAWSIHRFLRRERPRDDSRLQFAEALRRAWRLAKAEQPKRAAPILLPLDTLDGRIDALKYLPIRMSLAAEERRIRSEYAAA